MSSEQDTPNCDKNLEEFNVFIKDFTKRMDKSLKQKFNNLENESPPTKDFPQKVTYQEAITIKNLNKKIKNLFREVLIVLDELKADNLFKSEDQYYAVRNKVFKIGNSILKDADNLIEIRKLKGKKITYIV